MQGTNFTITRYSISFKTLWDKTVSMVRQSSFLFFRDFMEYHQDRFTDWSLVVFDQHQNVIALFPANVCRNQSDRIESHGGLTYGGLLLMPQATVQLVDEIFSAIRFYYSQQGFKEIWYKPVPHIYHVYPAEEDLYALYRHQAQLCSRSVSSVIDLRQPVRFSTLRKRKAKKAHALLRYEETLDIVGIAPFWRILNEVLTERHQTSPVHSLVELQYLMSRFPASMRLFVARHRETDIIVAGCLLFVSAKVIHVQYIASSIQGREWGALDGLFDYVIRLMQEEYPEKIYFDFGISTENRGLYLNEGLVFQKEGFGARAVCYDSYLLKTE